MKKVLFNALFMGLATLGFAQPKFTEQTLTEVHQAFITNGVKAVTERTSPDFIMFGSDGQTMNYTGFKALNESGGLVDWPVSEIKIKQSGNLAIVTSISKHTAVFKNGTKFTANERSTETFEYQKGKWMYLSAHYGKIDPPAFTEQIIHDFNKKWIENPSKSMDETYLPTYIYTDRNGSIRTYEQLKKQNETVKFLSWETSDINIKQSGTLATVTGTSKYSYNALNATVNNLVRGVYVFEYKNGQWLMASTHHTNIVPTQTPAEEAAIKAVIEKETQSWHNRDAEGRIACIANVPHALMLVHHGVMANNNGVAYVTNEKTNVPEMIKTQTAGMGKPDGTTFKNENYVVTIKGGTAFVTYTEITTAADGKKQYGHAVRNLERIDGFWKLTYVGGVVYKRD